MSTAKQLSLIIPVYNYREQITANLETLVIYLRERVINFEIIVVDDGSSDGTSTKIANANFGPEVKLIALPKNGGKGAAVKAGVEAAAKEKIIFMDADLPYRLEAILKICDALDGGADMAVGDRTLPGSRVGLKKNIIRTITSKLFVFFVRLLVLKDAHDTQCGIKGFRGDVAHKIFELLTITGFGFDVELMAIAEANNLRVARVPVEFTGRDGTTVKFARDSLRMIRDLIKIRRLKRMKYYRF
jgi:glycosyltransferase involved in cell wall biosynthesis